MRVFCKVRKIVALLLSMLMLIGTSALVYASESIGGGFNGHESLTNNNLGVAQSGCWAVRLKSIPGNGMSLADAYDAACFNQWDQTWFDGDIVNHCFFFSYESVPTLYALGDGYAVSVDAARTKPFIAQGQGFTGSDANWNAVADMILQGADWRSIVGTPAAKVAGNVMCSMIEDGAFTLFCENQAASIMADPNGMAAFPDVCYRTVVACMASVPDIMPFDESLMDTLWATKNADGSSSYVVMELICGGNWGESFVFYSYPTYFGDAWGLNPMAVVCASPDTSIDGIGMTPGDMASTWGNYVFAKKTGLGNYPGGENSSTPFFNRTPSGMASSNDRHWSAFVFQLNSGNSGLGQISSTYIGNWMWGPVTTSASNLGFVHLSASPKGAPAHAGDIQTAVITLDATCPQNTFTINGTEHDGSSVYTQLSNFYKPGTTLTFSLSAEAMEGGPLDNGSKIVDTTSVGHSSGNSITVTPTDKNDFLSYLNGTKKVIVEDKNVKILTDDGLKVKYKVILTFNNGTVKTAIPRGVLVEGSSAADVASWAGTGEVLYYHSGDGSGNARAEVKANTPNNEMWEAMGGVPTTETCYVSAGGSTHQVDYEGKVMTNPPTMYTVTINVTTSNCWAGNPACTENGCSGGGVHGTHQEPNDPLDPTKGTHDVDNPCDGTACLQTCDGCGQSFRNGCAAPQNKCHPADHTDTYTIQIPIATFNYIMTRYVNTNTVSNMKFEQNGDVFEGGGSADGPVTGTLTFTVPKSGNNQADYQSGNGRIYFNVTYDSWNHWGDMTINVSSDDHDSVHAGHNPASISKANKVLGGLKGASCTAHVISDFASIYCNDGSGNSYQNIAYDTYPCDSRNWFGSLPSFTGVGQSLTVDADKAITWNSSGPSGMRTGSQMFWNSGYRDLRGDDDVMTVGYNGNFTEVVNNGQWSGKFSSGGGAHGDSSDFYRGQGLPNVTDERSGSGSNGNNYASGSTHVTLTADNIAIRDDCHNGEVETGTVKLNYVKQYTTPASLRTYGAVSSDGKGRLSPINCVYTSGAPSVNNIVIHDPVSVQHSQVLSNPDSLDQRTDGSKILQGGDTYYENGVYNNFTGEWIKNEDMPFINLANWFIIEVSDYGDFKDDGGWNRMGLASCIDERCGGTIGGSSDTWGYVNNMDCDKWTKNRYVVFPFNVCVNMDDGSGNYIWSSIGAGAPLDTKLLQVYGTRTEDGVKYNQYRIFCPLNNKEFASVNVAFTSTAGNFGVDEYFNESNGVTNKFREGAHAAKHSATKNQHIDVVGNIGNLAINDTGDFRFAELFKKRVPENKWLIPNLVHEVDYKKPNKVVSDPKDILQNWANELTRYHSTFNVTYASTGGKAYPYAVLPLDGSDNVIPELRTQQLRPGYNLYMDIETTGNYYGENFDPDTGEALRENLWQRLVIHPYYYFWDYERQKYIPVDVYYMENGKYVPIVKFGQTAKDNDKWKYYLDWANESGRRNFTTTEKNITNNVVSEYTNRNSYEKFVEVGGGWQSAGMWIPQIGKTPDKYELIGCVATLYLDQFNRTFIGSPYLYGGRNNGGLNMYGDNFGSEDRETVGEWGDINYNRQSQRWQFTMGLPSTTKFVPAGTAYDINDQESFLEATRKISDRKGVIICLADIQVQGEVWALKYDGSSIWGPDKKIPMNPDNPGDDLPVPSPDNTVDPENPDDPGPGPNPPWYDPTNPTDPGKPDPPIAIYDNKYTSADDLRTEGTH